MPIAELRLPKRDPLGGFWDDAGGVLRGVAVGLDDRGGTASARIAAVLRAGRNPLVRFRPYRLGFAAKPLT